MDGRTIVKFSRMGNHVTFDKNWVSEVKRSKVKDNKEH